MDPFRGVGVALVTPFDTNNGIDEESLRILVEKVLSGGVNFLVALGTTAETPTLTMSERERVVTIIHDQIKGRVPLMVGVGGYSTQEVIEQLNTLSWLDKADAILSVTPYYNKPNQAGIYAHFSAIASVCTKPIFLYNVPGRTGVNIEADTVIRLAQNYPNIVGLKEATGGNMNQATQLMLLADSGFTLLSGDDSLVLPLMALGFHGVISVMANVEPTRCVELVEAVNNNDWSKARAIHYATSFLCDALFIEGNPVGIKAALHAKGIIRYNRLRLPLVPTSDALYARLTELL